VKIWRKMIIHAIQDRWGHVFWGQWKGDKKLNNTIPCIIMLASFPKVPKTYRPVWVYLHLNFRGGLRKTCFETGCIMALQGHLMSLILVPIESACATSYWSSITTLVLSCPVSEILQIFCREERPHPIPPEFWGLPLGQDCRCCSSQERRP